LEIYNTKETGALYLAWKGHWWKAETDGWVRKQVEEKKKASLYGAPENLIQKIHRGSKFLKDDTMKRKKGKRAVCKTSLISLTENRRKNLQSGGEGILVTDSEGQY